MFEQLKAIHSGHDQSFDASPPLTAPTPSLLREKISSSSLIQTVDENIENTDLCPAYLAKKLGLSRASLYRLAAPLGGVQHLITDRRLKVAYAIFTTKDKEGYSISELAYALGFNAESTFRRAYKNKYGISPRDTQKAKLST